MFLKNMVSGSYFDIFTFSKRIRCKIVLCILLLSTTQSSAQKDLIGLFGECNNGYVCQQIQFKKNHSFKYYDLLHLRGWKISKGFWKRNGDTIVLNSKTTPYKVKYSGESSTSNMLIKLKFVLDNTPAAFTDVFVNNKQLNTETTGFIIIRKEHLDSVLFRCPYIYDGLLFVEKDKYLNADSIEIILNPDFNDQIYFKDTKFVIIKDKLYYKQNDEIMFNKKVFQKTELKELKYSKKYLD